MNSVVCHLDAEALAYFASKGLKGGRGVPVGAGEANGARVRRVLQVTADIARSPISQLRILDLACGEGVFAIEAALKGADVLGVDARTVRMHEGQKIGERLRLDNLHFEQADVRRINSQSYGQFDVIYALGILYHLDVDDNFSVLRNIYAMCRQFVIIDTCIVDDGATQVKHRTGVCEGLRVREHEDDDPASTRQARPMASIDNTFSFLFTRASLCRALRDVGFTSIFECWVPLEPTKPNGRITLIAIKGDESGISTYPWINNKTEDQISIFLSMYADKLQKEYSDQSQNQPLNADGEVSARKLAKSLINGLLRPLNLEIRRRT